MPIHLRKQQGDRVEAVCDECDKRTTVRRNWALQKFRQRGTFYICRTCSSIRNLKKRKEKKMDQELVNQYVNLCLTIYNNLWDDKSTHYICSKLNVTDYYLVEIARDFVAAFIQDDVSHLIRQAATYIEDGADPDIMQAFEIDDELRGHALLALEIAPTPTGI